MVHCCRVTSPLFNPLWLIQWLSAAAERSAARKQSMQLTVAARATHETSRRSDASVTAAAWTAPAHRRNVDSNWEDTTEAHPKGWTRTPSRAKGIYSEGDEYGAAQLEEDRTTPGYSLICGVSFSRLLSNCALAPAASAWHGFPYTGCSAKVRIKLRNRILWRIRDRFSATFKPLIRTALIKILSIKVLQELVQKRKISYFIAFS